MIATVAVLSTIIVVVNCKPTIEHDSSSENHWKSIGAGWPAGWLSILTIRVGGGGYTSFYRQLGCLPFSLRF